MCSMQNAYNLKSNDHAGDGGGGGEDDWIVKNVSYRHWRFYRDLFQWVTEQNVGYPVSWRTIEPMMTDFEAAVTARPWVRSVDLCLC
jgi:hypothetical protein